MAQTRQRTQDARRNILIIEAADGDEVLQGDGVGPEMPLSVAMGSHRDSNGSTCMPWASGSARWWNREPFPITLSLGNPQSRLRLGSAKGHRHQLIAPICRPIHTSGAEDPARSAASGSGAGRVAPAVK